VVPLSSDGSFDAALPVGSYRFGLVPRGKFGLIGTGLDQLVECASGENVPVSARVNRISE
jgi:hypothetical protein